jgi:hypothetical protein
MTPEFPQISESLRREVNRRLNELQLPSSVISAHYTKEWAAFFGGKATLVVWDASNIYADPVVKFLPKDRAEFLMKD